MEISGSLFSSSPYSGTDLSARYSQHHPQQQQTPPQQAPAPVKQVIRPESTGYENRQRRFYSVDRDLSHSTRQALNSYRDLDEAGGGELMNRVDVYV